MRHLLLIGGTGAGKSTLILNMLREDMISGEGVLLIDPHGDVAETARRLVPEFRRDDLVWIDPADGACRARLDFLATPGCDADLERNFIVNQLIFLLSRQLYVGVPEAFGPIFEQYFRNALFLLLLASSHEDRSLMKLSTVFADREFRRRLIGECPDLHVREFWEGIAEQADGDHRLENLGPWITSKLAQFTGNPVTRRLLSTDQGEPINLASALDSRRIVIIRLAKGLLGEYDARFLGALFLVKLAEAAQSRARRPENERTRCRVYVDEFQHLATRSAADMLAECRKYGLSLTLANQSLSQLEAGRDGADVAQAALANCGSLALFRTSPRDAGILSRLLGSDVEPDILTRLGVGEFVARRIVDGAPCKALRVRALPPIVEKD